MSKPLVDQVKIAHDARWATVVSKDHNKGIVIQVCRLNPSAVSTSTGQVQQVHQPVVMLTAIVPIADKLPGTFRKPEDVELDVKHALHKANLFAATCKDVEDATDKLLAELERTYNGQKP